MGEVLPNLVKTIKFRRISPNDLIRAVSSQEVTLSPVGYHLVRFLFQEKQGGPFQSGQKLLYTPQIYFIMDL